MVDINPPYRLDPLQTITDLYGKSKHSGDIQSADYALITFGGTAGKHDWRPLTLAREGPMTKEEADKVKSNIADAKWEIDGGFNWTRDGPIPELSGQSAGGWETFGGLTHKANANPASVAAVYYEMDWRSSDYLGDDGVAHSADPMDFTDDGPPLVWGPVITEDFPHISGSGNNGNFSDSPFLPWKAIDPDKFYILYSPGVNRLDAFIVNLRQMGQTLIDYSAIIKGKSALGSFGTGGATMAHQGHPVKADLYDKYGELPPTPFWAMGFVSFGPYSIEGHEGSDGTYLLDRSQEGVLQKNRDTGKPEWSLAYLGPKAPTNGNSFVGRAFRVELFKADREPASGETPNNATGKKKPLMIQQPTNSPVKLGNATKFAQQSYYQDTDLWFIDNMPIGPGAGLFPSWQLTAPRTFQSPGNPDPETGIFSLFNFVGGVGLHQF
jgi:hypothetical protein